MGDLTLQEQEKVKEYNLINVQRRWNFVLVDHLMQKALRLFLDERSKHVPGHDFFSGTEVPASLFSISKLFQR